MSSPPTHQGGARTAVDLWALRAAVWLALHEAQRAGEGEVLAALQLVHEQIKAKLAGVPPPT